MCRLNIQKVEEVFSLGTLNSLGRSFRAKRQLMNMYYQDHNYFSVFISPLPPPVMCYQEFKLRPWGCFAEKGKLKILAEEEHFIKALVKQCVLMGLLLLLQGVILILFRLSFEGCPEAAFRADLLSIQRATSQAQPPGAASECLLKDARVCVWACRKGQQQVWWLRWFNVLQGTLDCLSAA